MQTCCCSKGLFYLELIERGLKSAVPAGLRFGPMVLKIFVLFAHEYFVCLHVYDAIRHGLLTSHRAVRFRGRHGNIVASTSRLCAWCVVILSTSSDNEHSNDSQKAVQSCLSVVYDWIHARIVSERFSCPICFVSFNCDSNSHVTDKMDNYIGRRQV